MQATASSGVQEKRPWLAEKRTCRNTGEVQRKSRSDKYPVSNGPPYTIQREMNVGRSTRPTTKPKRRCRPSNRIKEGAEAAPERKAPVYSPIASMRSMESNMTFG